MNRKNQKDTKKPSESLWALLFFTSLSHCLKLTSQTGLRLHWQTLIDDGCYPSIYQDRFYLEEDELARQLVEIGCRKGEAPALRCRYLVACHFPIHIICFADKILTGADTWGFRGKKRSSWECQKGWKVMQRRWFWGVQFAPQARLQNAPKALGSRDESHAACHWPSSLEASFSMPSKRKVLASAQKNLTDFPVLRHLAMREDHPQLGGCWICVRFEDELRDTPC